MNKSNKMIGFRYKKNFIKNKIKQRKLNLTNNPIKTGCRNECPICGCIDAYVIAEVDRVGFPCDTVVCKDCQFVFNDSFIAIPGEFYSHEWGIERWGDPETNFTNRTATNSYSWKRMAFVAKQLGSRFKDINSVLEVGCGDGCNLLPYHLIGKFVVGCDFDKRYLRPGLNRGMRLVEGDITAVSKEYKFDLVMLIHSFEHVLDMDKMIQQVKDYLTKDGVVFIEVPGILTWNRKKSKYMRSMGLESSNSVLSYLQFQHNYYFDLEHLKYVWERNGFKLLVGDQWVRAILHKNENITMQDEPINNIKSINKENIYDYLVGVEKDYLRLNNIACRYIRRLTNNKCN